MYKRRDISGKKDSHSTVNSFVLLVPCSSPTSVSEQQPTGNSTRICWLTETGLLLSHGYVLLLDCHVPGKDGAVNDPSTTMILPRYLVYLLTDTTGCCEG